MAGTVPIDDFDLLQGTTFLRQYTVLDPATGLALDLSNYAVRGQGRAIVPNNPTKLFDLTCTITDAVNGEFLVSLTAAETAALTAPSIAYDIEVEDPNGIVLRVVQGTMTLSLEATR